MKLKNAFLPALALALALSALTPHAQAQGVEGAPAFIDYQGMVFDGTNTDKPLGSTGASPNYAAAPTNYTMQFKIYDQQSAGNLIWAETQTVTVSLGAFAVRLGSGAEITTLPHGSIADAFNGKERYLELTVIPVGGVGGTPITPRLAFQASPFSFVAERAKLADAVVGKVTATADSTFTGGTFTGGTIGTSSSPAKMTGTLTGNVHGNVTGTASNVTEVISIANGGTGSSSKNFVDTTGNQSGILGNKSFSNSIAVGTTAAPTDNVQVYGLTPGIKVTNTEETYSGLTMEDSQATTSQYGAIRYDSGSNNLGLFVNSTTPKVVVQSSGNLKFGPTANFHAAGSNNAIRIVRGYVYGTTASMSILSSSGDFTATRTGVGLYRIDFNTGTFSGFPIVTANCDYAVDNFMSVSLSTTNYILLECWDNDNQERQDSSFHFIAIGPR